MRSTRGIGTIAAVLAVVLLAAACSGGSGDGPHAGALNAEEQELATAFAADLGADTGVPVTPDQARCISEAVLHELGLRPFHDAGVGPEDLTGTKTLGELFGKGRVTDAQGTAIAAAWEGCAGTTDAFAEQARVQVGLDEPGVTCFRARLTESGAVQRYRSLSFTTDDPAEVQGVLDQISGFVESCAKESGQAARVVAGMADSIAGKGTMTGDEARCLAQHIVDALGVGNLLSIGSAAGLAAAPIDVQRSVAQGLVDAAAACRVPLERLGPADPG